VDVDPTVGQGWIDRHHHHAIMLSTQTVSVHVTRTTTPQGATLAPLRCSLITCAGPAYTKGFIVLKYVGFV